MTHDSGDRRHGHARPPRRPATARRRAPGAGPQPPQRAAEADVEYVTGDLATGEGVGAAVDRRRGRRALRGHGQGRRREGRARSSRRPRRPGCATSCTSRSSAPTGCRSTAASTARCSATTRPSSRPSGPWPTPGCRGRRCAPPSSTTSCCTTVRQMAKLPVVPVPSGFRFQPVDTDEVADRLVELALGAAGRPRGRPRRPAGVRAGATSSAATCGPAASTARSCRCGCPARPPARCAPARTSRPTVPSAGGRGRSSWPRGLVEQLAELRAASALSKSARRIVCRPYSGALRRGERASSRTASTRIKARLAPGARGRSRSYQRNTQQPSTAAGERLEPAGRQ